MTNKDFEIKLRRLDIAEAVTKSTIDIVSSYGNKTDSLEAILKIIDLKRDYFIVKFVSERIK